MDTKCLLCKKKESLNESHLIPKFAYDWIKKTSVTGYMRRVTNANLRMQDGDKPYMFCKTCENLFSRFESDFAQRIFYPYVNNELDKWGVATGEITSFDYTEWLLRFIISLQYRHLVNPNQEYKNELDTKKVDALVSQIPIWEDYLRGNRSDTGYNRSYVIFLQNISTANGYFPNNMNPKINRYILRSVDATVASSQKRLGIYTKIGPILIFTTIIPAEIKQMNSIIVKKRGKLNTAQYLKDNILNKFIFIDRPNEALQKVEISKKQQHTIELSALKNKSKVIDSLETRSFLSDIYLSKRLKKK